ncbi:hypothetical protein PAMP_019174 [Pampus punctatissimus]
MQGRDSEVSFVQQILGLNLVPRKNGTHRGNDTSLSDFSEMWYGVFLWAAVSSLVFHLPAALLSLATLRQHKIARFMPIAILLMGIVGPLCGGVLTKYSPPSSSAEARLAAPDTSRTISRWDRFNTGPWQITWRPIRLRHDVITC